MNGFIKLKRSPETLELLKDKIAFMQLTQISYWAARKARIVIHNGVTVNLEANQAFIGNFRDIGLTEGEYREAKKRLTLRKLATFKTTNKGTIATLINQDVFDINPEITTDSTTDKPQAGNGQTTTNKKYEEFKKNFNNDKKITTILKKPLMLSFWKWLKDEKSNGDPFDAARYLYRARARNAKNLERYIESGFEGICYICKPCHEEESDPRKVNGWIDNFLKFIKSNDY
jgi:hypothetical protein